jgi:hypothetical protein
MDRSTDWILRLILFRLLRRVSRVVANGRRETIGASQCVDLFSNCTFDVGLLNRQSVSY